MASADGPRMAPSAGAAGGGPVPRTGSDVPGGAPYTAVVYVHGMGSQRRFEELSRLIDRLDRHARANDASAGTLVVMTPRLEELRADSGSDVSYIEVIREPPQPASGTASAEAIEQGVRFYEAYWAPVAAGGTSLRAVIAWLARQAVNPIRTAASAWRYRSRLRRASLHELVSTGRATERDPALASDLETLVRLYDDFDAPPARRAWPRGRFRDFLELISTARPTDARRLQRLARRWRWRYARSEVVAFITVMTILLALALGAAFIAGAVLALALWLRSLAPGPIASPISLNLFLALLAGALGALGFTRFLVEYMGDVQLWTTYEETSAKRTTRNEILRSTTRLLAHALGDPACQRVAVVAHSLGTTIALDSLLELARHNRARHPEEPMDGPLPLRKIEHFITLGSPIDKVHYFFEHYQGRLYRYNQIVEALRGDIGTPPFASVPPADESPRPHIHWINVWDRGDVIGGSVESPSHPRHASLRVDNVEVRGLLFPDPAASHRAYFDSSIVIGIIFRAVFDRAFSFVRPPLATSGIADYASRFVGPGRGGGPVRAIQALMLTIPWLVVAGLLTTPVEGEPAWGWLDEVRHSAWVIAAGMLLALMIAGAIAARVRGNLEPIEEPRERVAPDP